MVMRMCLSRWLKSMPEKPVLLSVAALTSAVGVGVTITGSIQLRSRSDADQDIHSINAGPPGRALRCGVGVGVAAGVWVGAGVPVPVAVGVGVGVSWTRYVRKFWMPFPHQNVSALVREQVVPSAGAGRLGCRQYASTVHPWL